MPVLRVALKDGERFIPFSPGQTVREILESAGIRFRSVCGGIGACGLCLIRIMEGTVNGPTENEQLRLSPRQTQIGIRFACQTRPHGNVRLSIENPVQQIQWRDLAKDEYRFVRPQSHLAMIAPNPEIPFGVAVDLGTTYMRVSLLDMLSGRWITGRSGLNPQAVFGADVLTRLSAAVGSKDLAAEINRLARDAIGEALREMAVREGLDLLQIGRVVIVGNTAMLSLFAKKNYDLLLDPVNWLRGIDCSLDDTGLWRISWGIGENASVEIVQPLAGFVGSDILAGVLATQLTEGTEAALLMDFGTNSEIALWDGAVLWVTSTSGGPAFEGCGISCGMPAEAGAIFGVSIEDPSAGFRCEVLGDSRPKGICGSGLVDSIACLLRAGRLNSGGRFSQKTDDQGIVLQKDQRDIILKKQDIDLFQRAKAAIAAGTICLAEKSGILLKDLKRVCISGAFGQYLNVGSAREVGLVPDIPTGSVELCGNTALAGCELLLLDQDMAGTLEALKKKSRMINMTQVPEFEGLFIESLYLRPMKMG